jgi:hypothetical protein
MEKGLIAEALTPNNGWKPWERVGGVLLGALLDPGYYLGQALKKAGIDTSDCDIEPWDYR